MRSIVTRMLTTISLMALLLVVAVGVRVQSLLTDRTIVEWPLAPELYVPSTQASASGVASLAAEFEAQELPDYAAELVRTRVASTTPRAPRQVRPTFQKIDKEINILEEVFAPGDLTPARTDDQWKAIQGSIELPKEPNFETARIEVSELPATSLVSLLDDLKLPTETMVAEATPVVDEPKVVPAMPVAPITETTDKVTMTQSVAAEVDAEPEFFEYEKTEAPVIAEEKVPAPAEYSRPEVTEPEPLPQVSSQPAPEPSDDIQAYSYTPAMPASAVSAPIAAVTTQAPVAAKKPVTTQKPEPMTPVSTQTPKEESMGFVSASTASPASTKISALSINSTPEELRDFELRAHDDSAQIIKDNGSGSAVINEEVVGESGARSFELIHRDHVPTHADIPVVAGQVELEIPVFTREFLAQYTIPHTQRPLGYFLVELDDETESVHVDGLKNTQKFFTSDFKQTTTGDHRYVLVSGVEVGNRLVSYKRGDGKISQKIVHIHDEEVTFDPNLYAGAGDLVLSLFEEDLLSRERRELAISGEQVELTFSGKKAEKLSTASYKLKTPPLLLGSRHYVTLTHQNEEIFVGVDKSKDVDVPSEPLIREVIRKFGIQGNSAACLVQINLDGALKKYEVLAESHGQGHVSYGLALDADGQFYESLGENSRRLFIMSENQSGDSAAENAKINLRLEYQDGSKRNFSTFCSPNTYLVEQL